jgi:hypothetical protein
MMRTRASAKVRKQKQKRCEPKRKAKETRKWRKENQGEEDELQVY